MYCSPTIKDMPAFKDVLLRGKPNPHPVLRGLGSAIIESANNFTTCIQPIVIDGGIVYAISQYGEDELLLVHDDDDLPLSEIPDDPFYEVDGINTDPLPPGLSKAMALEPELHIKNVRLLKLVPDIDKSDYYPESPADIWERNRIETKYSQVRFGRFRQTCHSSLNKLTHFTIMFFLGLFSSFVNSIFESLTGIRKIVKIEHPVGNAPETMADTPAAQQYEKGSFTCPICGKKDLTHGFQSFTKVIDMQSDNPTEQQMEYIDDYNRYGVYLCRHCHDRMVRRARWFLGFALLLGIVFLFTVPALLVLVALAVLLFKLFAMKLDFTFEHAWECGAVRRVKSR